MKLLTKAIESKLLSFEEQDKLFDQANPDPVIQVKYFCPWGSWSWYAYAYDPETRIMSGVVDGFEVEAGDFSLAELEAITGPFGLKIERDLYFEPIKMLDLIDKLKRTEG